MENYFGDVNGEPWRTSGDLYWITLGYPQRSILDIKWDIIWRVTGDLFRRSLEIIRISWEILLGYLLGYYMEM